MNKILQFILIPFILLAVVYAATAAPTAVTRRTANETPYYDGQFTDADQANGNKVNNADGLTQLIFMNTNTAGTATVTITAQKTTFNVPGVGPLTKSNITCSLTALSGSACFVGKLNATIWNDASGMIQVTYSGNGSGDVKLIPFAAPAP